ncbi:MAG: MoaD/ThiS family protein [Candidatus Bathyarchaeota archaeon]|nr:MoaD/ThiS family protein [Candidatus Bathyarchaeota archaeon]
MRVRIVYLGLVRSKVGKREEEYEIGDGSSLSNLLNSLAETYGESLKGVFEADDENRLDPTFIATVNGSLADPIRGGDIPLSPGDTVALMTLISGG